MSATATRPNIKWNVALVDDDDEFRSQFIELASHTHPSLNIIPIGDFAKAKNLLDERRLDIAVLDLCRGRPEQSDQPGIGVLQAWKGIGFCPVIIHSAIAESVMDQKNAFVRVIPREGADKLLEEITRLIDTKIPLIHRAIQEHISSSMREYMWGFVDKHWQQFEPVSMKPDFLRLILARLAEHFSRQGISALTSRFYPDHPQESTDNANEETIHPAHVYVVPPVGSQPMLGDIRRLAGAATEQLVVVLTPTCDFFQKKAEIVLCAEAVELANLPHPKKPNGEYQEWASSPDDTKKLSGLRNLLGNKREGTQSERFYYLPGVFGLPHMVLDFQRLLTVPLEKLSSSPCLARIASPFAEAISAQFVRYVGRIGTPVLDIDSIVKGLRTGLPKSENGSVVSGEPESASAKADESRKAGKAEKSTGAPSAPRPAPAKPEGHSAITGASKAKMAEPEKQAHVSEKAGAPKVEAMEPGNQLSASEEAEVAKPE